MAEPIISTLGIVGIKNCGVYDNNTNYEKLNVVTYEGSSYCAKGNTVGNLPTNTTYWDLLAQKGDAGPQGPQGIQGPKPVKGVDYWTNEDIADIEAELSSDVSDEVSTQVGDLVSATPLAATSTAGMTDTSRIYVNTTDGHWYWYNGTAWTDGGVYQSSVSDDMTSDSSINSLQNKVITRKIEAIYNEINEIQLGTLQKSNILDNPFVNANKNISTTDGSLIDGSRSVTDYIEQIEGYNIKIISLTSDQFRVVRYNPNDTINFLNWSTEQVLNYSSTNAYKYRVMSGDNTSLGEANSKYIICYISSNLLNINEINSKLKYANDDRFLELIIQKGYDWYFEEDTDNSLLFIKAYPWLLVRGVYPDIPDITKSWSDILTEVTSTYTDTSTKGVENCVKIPSGKGLYFDIVNRVFLVNNISSINLAHPEYVLIALSWNGKLVSGTLCKQVGLYAFKIAQNNESIIESNDLYIIPNDIEDSILTGINKIVYNYPNTIKLGMLTDIHQNYKAYKYTTDFAKYKQLDELILGGDYNSTSEQTLEKTKNEMLKTDKAISQISLYNKLLPIKGNHDGVLNSMDYTSEMFANAVIKPYVDCNDKGWYYYDDTKNKLRIIVLNSAEDTQSRKGFSSTQIAWFADTINNTPSDYSVITVTHHPIAGDGLDKAYSSDLITSIIENFKTNRPNDYICHMFGHQHSDELVVENGVTYVGTTASDRISSDLALDIFCINKSTKTVNIVRVGNAGQDRSFTY